LDIFKRLIHMAGSHLPKFILALLCMLVVGTTTAALAFLIKPAMDDIFLNKDATTLKWLPVAVIVIYMLKGICSWSQTVLMNFIGLRIVADLRNRLYRRIQEQSLTFFTKHPTGILMSRITNDVTLIQAAVSEAVTSLLKDSFMLVGLVFVIFYRDWKLAVIAMFIFPLAVYPIAKFGSKLRHFARSTQVTMGSLSALLQETISGARIVKAFGMEEYENQRFAKENERLFKLNMKSISVIGVSSPFMEFLGGLGIAAIIFYGGYQVIQGNSTPGTFFSFLAALIMLYEPVKRLTNVNNTIQQGIAASQRVFEILDTVPDIQNSPGASNLRKISNHIEIQNVTFGYEGTPVLKNINLTIRAGEMIAFVGMSGGGKTTLVNLIPRFYDVDEGRIRIDGQDIRTVTLASLRSQIGIVTQQTILFNDTVKNNIAYGDINKSEAEIIAASKAANAHDFIMNLPNAYETIIGEQGAKLSGGERQRISIARALLKNAPILILDEATSSLDSEAEIEVQDALETLMQGRTTLTIAHRLSTIRKADRIIVLVNGIIAEEGTHEALLDKRGEYFRLYQMQFNNERQE
jgi:subfamily B ATP-binding cassette protein MsbA